MRIDDKHLTDLRENGYTLVPNFLSQDELEAAMENMLRYYPTAEELEETPERYGSLLESPDAGQSEFPFAGETLNNISTHPDLIDFVERILGTRDILLSQSAIWAKYAGGSAYDQGMHLDYQGNTLVVPRDDGDYRQVNMILYYTDVTEDLGPTCVVPISQTRDLALWPAFKPRKQFPQLYSLEKKIIAKKGSLLIFGMRTFHRASEITADFGMRFSHHMIWRSARHVFQGFQQWSSQGEDEDLQDFITHATPRQREVLGFPKPADPFWNEETIAAAALRYPEMDMTVYKNRISNV